MPDPQSSLECWRPVLNRPRVAAVKEKRFTGIQRNLRHGYHRKVVTGTLRDLYWTLNGRVHDRMNT